MGKTSKNENPMKGSDRQNSSKHLIGIIQQNGNQIQWKCLWFDINAEDLIISIIQSNLILRTPAFVQFCLKTNEQMSPGGFNSSVF